MDKQITELIKKETSRQENSINLIASENYTPKIIREIAGSVLTNKYAEGYPSKRYYSGCQIIDEIENLAIERCKKLFGAEHANVQPHSGSQANMAVYNAILKPGDKIMGMSLNAGGHLTHGHKLNFSGINYRAVQYGVNKKNEFINFDKVEKIATKEKPKLIIAGASAYSREIDFKKFSRIAKKVGAYLLVDMAHIAGLVATGLHNSPVEYADFVTSTTHKTLRGPRSGFILCKSQYSKIIDRAVMPGVQSGPHMHTIAAKAACFYSASQKNFKTYQKNVIANSKTMAEKFKSFGYRVVSGGTDNHLFVLDLENKKISGFEAEKLLQNAGINVNRNVIPFETRSPLDPNGIRIGTPAITTREMGKKEAEQIVGLINELIENRNDSEKIKFVAKEVLELTKKFPVKN